MNDLWAIILIMLAVISLVGSVGTSNGFSLWSVIVISIIVLVGCAIWGLVLIGQMEFGDSPTQFRLYLYGMGTGIALLVLGFLGFGVYSLIQKRIDAGKKDNDDEK